jgi:membrane protease YdiL (CAAX protease family)
LTFLALTVWTPLSEEVFFRGFIFAGLSSRWGVTGATLVSAAIFSAFHISPGVLIPIFITGLLLAWLYHQTGSLWASIAAHAGQNAAALVVTIYGV